MYNANLQVKYVKSNVESKNLIAKMFNIECENLEVQPAELEYCVRKGECTRQKLKCCTRKVG